jgi:hypothetical protein
MKNSLFQFLYGIYFSLVSICEIRHVIFNQVALKIYLKLFLVNLFLTILKNLCDKFNNYLEYLTNDTYFTFIFYTIFFLTSFIMYVFIYPFCYIWTLDGVGNILNNILNSTSKKISFELISEKIYFLLLGIIFYSLNIFLYYIPIIGFYITFINNCYCYSYFCLDYGSQFNKIPNYDKFIILENNPVFFLGFGLIYGCLSSYFNLFNFSTLFTLIFPLSVLHLSKYFDFTITNKKNYSKIFYIPVKLLHYILILIDNLLQIIYKTNHSSESSVNKSKLE